MKLIYLTILSLMFFINGCAIRGPSIALEPPRIEIDGVDHDHGKHKKKHCPPGQAKKGNC